MHKTIFVTGISTDVGKTVISAIITKALKADYWKPIQSGDLQNSDTHKVKKLVNNNKTKYYPSSYALKTPMSPHAAAAIEEIIISPKLIKRPNTNNTLVIEGAGGLLVPLNNTVTIADLIEKNDFIVVVSKHYLGSINHTLLTITQLKNLGFSNIAIVFNGEHHPSTEHIITLKTNCFVIGRIDEEPYIDQNIINEYALLWKENLLSFLNSQS